MGQPSKLERNLDTLLAHMSVLKQTKVQVQRKRERKLKSWIQKVEATEHELDEIQKEVEQLKTRGFHPNNYSVRLDLNKRVIENLRVMESLENTDFSGESDDIDLEAKISELEKEKRPQRFTSDQLMNITSNVIIGHGKFGDVYKGKLGKVDVAVKVLQESVIEKQLMKEISPMFTTSHKNLIRLHGYCIHPKKKALVYEYMVKGSLGKFLYNKEANLKWDTLYQIAIGTARALANLHEDYSEPIVHYNIKAANVLLDVNYTPKVTDFGLCKIYEKDVSHVIQTSTGGINNYTAPEISMGSQKITVKCDVFSFGLMLFEILQRKRISRDYPLQVWEILKKGRLDEMILGCGIEKKDMEEAQRLAIVGLWCTQFLPTSRPKMSNVVKVLEGLMQFSSLPPNPDPYGVFTGADETVLQSRASIKSYDCDESSDEIGMESWKSRKYTSRSNFDIAAKTAAASIHNELTERFKKASATTSSLTRPILQNKPSKLEEVRRMDDRRIPIVPNVQRQTRRPNIKEFNIPLPSAEAIPSIQYELNQRFGKISASRG